MNIHEFIKGNEIVRTEAAKSLGSMIDLSGQTIDRGGDRSYMGQKLIFAGIANGQIYAQRTDALDIRIFGDGLIDLSLDLWSDGWEKWNDPANLSQDIMSKSELEKQIQIAIDNENYELAEKLKKK